MTKSEKKKKKIWGISYSFFPSSFFFQFTNGSNN